MCGIAGFSAPRADAADIIETMLAAIAHRGPDGAGLYIDRGIAFGHLRLAIVDLAGGAQPRIDDATGDALIFNGEIYGFREQAALLRAQGIPLRDQSDTEILFQLLRLHGVEGAVQRIDGMFAFAYREGRTGTLYLVRDRFGEKPLHYAVIPAGIVFGSEASAILAHPAFDSTAPDLLAAYQLLQFEYLPGTASGWQGIAKLPPATILTFRNDTATLSRYWQPATKTAPVSEPDAVDRLDELLKSAIGRQVVADVELGVFLSGGLDSSLIAAIAAREVPDILALTVRVGGDGFDETPFAGQAARHIGIRHDIVTFSDADLQEALDGVTENLSEPLADASLLPTWLVCRAASRAMKVALGGDGADELFCGYPNFQAQRAAPLMRRIPAAAGELLGSGASRFNHGGYMNLGFKLAQLTQGFGHPEHRQSYLWMAPFGASRMQSLWNPDILPAGIAETAFAPIDAAASGAGRHGAERLMHQFLTTYLPEDILTKTDRAAMFNGLEVRAPFLDRAFAEYACSIPVALKHRKHILKQLARRYLPDTIVDRKKHGFGIPVGDLLRGLFRTRLSDTILCRSNPIATWFNRQTLQTLLAEHLSGRHDHGKRLWAIFVLFTVASRRHAPARLKQPALHV